MYGDYVYIWSTFGYLHIVHRQQGCIKSTAAPLPCENMYGNTLENDKCYIESKSILMTYSSHGDVVRKQICPVGRIAFVDSNLIITLYEKRLYIFSTTTSSLHCEVPGEFISGKTKIRVFPDVICILDWNGRLILVSRSTWTVQRSLSFEVPVGSTSMLWLGQGTLYIRTSYTIRLIKIYNTELEAFHIFLMGALGVGRRILRADGDHSIKYRIGKWLVQSN